VVKRTPHGVEGTWATRSCDPGAQRRIHVIKHRDSAFFLTDLDRRSDMMVDQLIVFGVVTNICVRSTVHDAFFNGGRAARLLRATARASRRARRYRYHWHRQRRGQRRRRTLQGA
jgi:nicotinamidase-related amidase